MLYCLRLDISIIFQVAQDIYPLLHKFTPYLIHALQHAVNLNAHLHLGILLMEQVHHPQLQCIKIQAPQIKLLKQQCRFQNILLCQVHAHSLHAH